MAQPREYLITLRGIRERIREARLRAVLVANTMLVRLYWDVGRIILDRQARAGWGSRIIDRLSADLRESFPDMTGFSSRNLKYMRAFAATWPGRAIVQEPLAQLPWSHHILVLQIEGRAHERQGRAITNVPATLPPAGSDLAEQVFKDPYLFDFLGTADLRRERDVERALVERVQRFLMELGTGFAFVGRQVPLRVGNRDYLVDLLLYHLKLRCRTRERIVVEYALRHLERPIGVARWQTKLVDELPATFRGSLPTVAQIEAELRRDAKVRAKRRPRRRGNS